MWKKLKITGINSPIGLIDTYFLIRDDKSFGEEHFHVPACLFLLLGSSKGQKLSTQKSRASDLALFLNTLEFPENLHEKVSLDWRRLTDAERAGYLSFLKVERGNSDATIQRAASTLSAFYKFSLERLPVLESYTDFSFYFNKGVSVTEYRSGSITPRRVKSQYIDRLLFDEIENNVTSKSAFIRMRNLIGIRLGRNSGLRAHEVTLKGNFTTRGLRALISEMHVRGESEIEMDIRSEKGNKERPIVIKQKDIVFIKRFLNGPRSKLPEGELLCRSDGLAFSSESTPATSWFKQARNKAMPSLLANYGDYCTNPKRKFILAKKCLKGISFHSGRHSYATDLVGEAYEDGTDPKELLLVRLGHVDKKTLAAYITVDALTSGRRTNRSDLDISMEDVSER
ncbi:site-specific integrase [Pseudoalteromonas sp. N1230-9]|uniref:site-specific integrase n=1 Tax=Pseudoalteromonas sp. N1230-9 TaxID=2907156 RepID=UPI002B2D1821|nr:site-specific integrase [Pseudoalteromonas sp. N1230-9]